ncbi:MAG: glycosyltransferase family 2 protein [bacterium]|nr:glycosyl transferase family 2 [Deltaproteobacteria bacterium]MCP4907658.1 glycosyltransferase family 2 protein [bacterium]
MNHEITHPERQGVQATLCVIVPCYNEVDGIRKTVESLLQHLSDTDQSFEIVVVDDGSSDGSSGVLDELDREYAELRVAQHRRNRGYGAALKTGIRRSSAEFIAITDADGSYPLERLPELIALCWNADMVVGARTAPDVEYPLIRRIPKSFLVAYSSWLTGEPIPDINSGMRVFRRSVADNYMNILPDTFSFTSTITMALLCNRYDVRFVPIGYTARIGRSKIRPIRDTLRIFQLILRTGMYFAPIRVLAPLIAVLSLAFLASISYDVFISRNLTDKTVLLLLFAIQTATFTLLADMIDKRSGR